MRERRLFQDRVQFPGHRWLRNLVAWPVRAQTDAAGGKLRQVEGGLAECTTGQQPISQIWIGRDFDFHEGFVAIPLSDDQAKRALGLHRPATPGRSGTCRQRPGMRTGNLVAIERL